MYDTSKEELARVTYQPPSLSVASINGPIPRPAPEQKYLSTLFNGDIEASTDLHAPVEVYLSKELSNPHSRAKKQARWQAYQLYKKALLKDFTDAETLALNGRAPREAKADAVWKWREALAAEVKAKKVTSREAASEKTRSKSLRKIRRARKQRQRLTNLALDEDLNQVIPSHAE